MVNRTKESIIARYNELQPEGGSRFTPRVGFYLIQEVFEDSKHAAFHKARAIWKERKEDSFIEAAVIEVQLMSFIETAPNRESFDVSELALKTVQVYDCFWSEIEYKSKSYPILKCNWSIDGTAVVVKSPNKLPLSPPPFLDLITGTLDSFLVDFDNSLDFDTRASIEDEENRTIDETLLVEVHGAEYGEDVSDGYVEDVDEQFFEDVDIDIDNECTII